ncbi:MAG TPA: CYTH domain-containing protein [Bacteroidetes bacterium]|nr:CYTH domain-containing protein [Bacteroidota bacterium]
MKNVEIKAKCFEPEKVEKVLLENGADYKGLDHQTDTYFNVRTGRLKMRQGNIEKSLIYYDRPNRKGPKQSTFNLYKSDNLEELKPLLESSLGIMVEVKKHRKIFFIDYVKFHIDEVEGLGSFVEIEAGDLDNTKSVTELREKCDYYMRLLEIKEENLVNISYSDMLMGK